MKKPVWKFLSVFCAAAWLLSPLGLFSAAELKEGQENLALGKTAVATYEQNTGGYNGYAGNAVDGDTRDSRWSTYGFQAQENFAGALQVDLGARCELDRIVTYWFHGSRTYTYSVYVTDQPMIAGGALQEGFSPAAEGLVGQGYNPGQGSTEYRFPEKVTGRYLTLVVTGITGGTSAALYELEVYGAEARSAESNLALGKTAVATYEQNTGGYNGYAGNAVDGDTRDSRWSTYGFQVQDNFAGALQVDLGARCELDRIVTYWFHKSRTYTYSVYVTDRPMIAGGELQGGVVPAAEGLVGQGYDPGQGSTEYRFSEKVTGRYLTLVVTGIIGGTSMALYELEAYGVEVGSVTDNIVRIPAFTQRRAVYGTPREELSLPAYTTVTLDTGAKQRVELSWNCEDYDPGTPGAYTFVGMPELESGLTNTQGLTASLEVTVCQEGEDLSGRQVVDLSEGWTFHKGSAAGAQMPGYNDISWQEVNIPHTWNALDGQDGGNDYYRGDGWYRKVLDWNDAYAGKRLVLEFLGANMQADVYVNGKLLGTHKGGYTAFRFDVTDALIPGQENAVAVKVNNEWTQDIAPLGADFTFFGGLYREVSLVVTDPVHIDTMDHGSSGLYLTQTNVSREHADLEVRAEIVNDGTTQRTVTVRAVLKHPDSFEAIAEVEKPEFDPADMTGSGVVAVRETTLTIPAGGSAEFRQTIEVENPHLWNGREDPYRYQVELEVLEGGSHLDRQTGHVGFRFFSVDYDNGFFLNGEAYPLRGVSRHQEWEDMGNALTETEHNVDFGLIYEMGCTAVRLAHYPQAPYFYDLCDRYGIVVWAEIPFITRPGGSGTYDHPDADLAAFMEITKQQLVELIRQQYNRPSICFWGLQNEVQDFPEIMPQFMAELNDLAHGEDPTRLTTQATHMEMAKDWPTDLLCWNRYPGWYFGTKEDMGPDMDGKHAADERPLGISEYGAGSNIEHHTDKATNADKNMDFQTEEYQNICHESFIQQINARPYLWCTFVWNMFDFASDGRAEGGLTGINTKGLVTHDRQTKKDSFYLYKANWSDDPFVHITSRRFVNREKKYIEIKGYSNCDRVELTVNGQLIGALTQEELRQETVFIWENVPLELGENTVVMTAYQDGRTYTDIVTWHKGVSSDTALESDTLRVDNNLKTISLTTGARAENLDSLLISNAARLELLAADGVTPVTTGPVEAGMLLRVTSEDGDHTAVYTFLDALLSEGKTIAASSYQDNQNGTYPPALALDGDPTSRWTAEIHQENGTDTASYPQWITVDLGEVYALSRLDVDWYASSDRRYFYTVSVSSDGNTFVPVADRSANPDSGLVTDLLEDVKGRYVRLDITGNNIWPGSPWTAASIFEIRVYGKALEEADTAALELLLQEAEAVDRNSLTEASAQRLEAAIRQAKEALSEPTKESIAAAELLLRAALDGQEEKPPQPTAEPGGPETTAPTAPSQPTAGPSASETLHPTSGTDSAVPPATGGTLPMTCGLAAGAGALALVVVRRKRKA